MKTAYDVLMDEYKNRIAPLDERIRENEEIIELLKDHNPDVIFQAQIGVLSRQIEEATARGELGKAGELRAEIEKIETQLEERNNERARAWRDTKQVIEEKKLVAQKVLDEIFPALQRACWDSAQRHVDLLDATWDSLQQYERETRVALSRFAHHDRLKVSNYGPTLEIFRALSRWGLGD